MDILTIFLAGFLIVLYFLYRYVTAPNNHWAKLGVINVKRSSILDFFLQIYQNQFHELDVERRKRYGNIYGYYDITRPSLIVSEPSLIKNILVKDFGNFPNGREFDLHGDIFEDMLFAMKGARWKRVRTIISPVFTTGKIKKVFPYITYSAKTLLKNLSKCAKRNESGDVRKFYEAFSMDLIANSAFSTKIDSHNDPKNPFVVNARTLFDLPFPWRFILFSIAPKFMEFFGISISDPKGTNFFKKVCSKIIEERKKIKGEKLPNDFIQLMMDSSIDAAEENMGDDDSKSSIKNFNDSDKVLSQNELIGNSVMFFLVAFGTTSLTLSVVSYLMALNPDCQEKLIKEIDETLEKCENELTYEAIQSMKYLDMVISEALRLYPVAPRTERVAAEDYILGDTGIKVSKGNLITIPIYSIHHDPEFYPDPEKFDPERFSPEEKTKRDTYTYLPFGAGPRNCVGMRFALFNLKACLTYVFSQFRFRKCLETKVPLKLLSSLQGVIQVEKIMLKVEERTDKVLKDFY